MAQQVKGKGSRFLHQLTGLGGNHAQDTSTTSSNSTTSPMKQQLSHLFGNKSSQPAQSRTPAVPAETPPMMTHTGNVSTGSDGPFSYASQQNALRNARSFDEPRTSFGSDMARMQPTNALGFAPRADLRSPGAPSMSAGRFVQQGTQMTTDGLQHVGQFGHAGQDAARSAGDSINDNVPLGGRGLDHDFAAKSQAPQAPRQSVGHVVQVGQPSGMPPAQGLMSGFTVPSTYDQTSAAPGAADARTATSPPDTQPTPPAQGTAPMQSGARVPMLANVGAPAHTGAWSVVAAPDGTPPPVAPSAPPEFGAPWPGTQPVAVGTPPAGSSAPSPYEAAVTQDAGQASRAMWPTTGSAPSRRPDASEMAAMSRTYYVRLLHFFRTQPARSSLLTASRSNAREKLTRLNRQQFAELSTDVHDELLRRQEPLPSSPHLEDRDEFHPKRNQARQKLATLPKSRFRDLASDVFIELERRYPELPQELRPEPLEALMAPRETSSATAAPPPPVADVAPATLGVEPMSPILESATPRSPQPQFSTAEAQQQLSQVMAEAQQHMASDEMPGPMGSAAVVEETPAVATGTVSEVRHSGVRTSLPPLSMPESIPAPDTSLRSSGMAAPLMNAGPMAALGAPLNANGTLSSSRASAVTTQSSDDVTSARRSDGPAAVATTTPLTTAAALPTSTVDPTAAALPTSTPGAAAATDRTDEVRTLQERIQQLELSEKTAQGRVHELESYAPEAQTRMAMLEAQALEAQSRAQQLSTNEEAAQTRVRELEAVQQRLQQQLHDQMERMQVLEQQVRALEARSSETARERDEHRSTVQELQEHLEKERLSQAQATRAYQAQIAQHQRDLEDRDRQVQQHRQDLDSLRTEREALLEERQRQPDPSLEAQWRAEIDAMQQQTQEQELMVQGLRSEVASLLEELRRLSARNDAMMADKESDVAIIRDLHQQMSTFKRRYEGAKAELRVAQSTSQLWSQPTVEDWKYVAERGAIADTNVHSFQMAIDELLTTVRSSTPSNVLVAMKTVVLSTTLISDDIAKYEAQPENELAHLTPQQREDVNSLKFSLSEAMSNLMTACRNHASSQGLAPVSLVDAAATHVAMAVVELTKLLKLRRVPKPAEDDTSLDSASEVPPPSGLKPLHIIGNLSGSGFLPRGSQSRAASSSSPVVRSLAYSHSNVDSGKEVEQDPYSPMFSPASAHAGDSSARSARRLPSRPSHPAVPDVLTSPTLLGKALGGARPNQHSPASAASASLMAATSSPQPSAAVETASSQPATSAETAPPQPATFAKTAPPQPATSADTAPPEPATSDDDGAPRSADVSVPAAGHAAEEEENWAELRNYIEVQTEAIVHSIQSLLSALRDGAQGPPLNENLTEITTIVSSIVAISRDNLPQATTYRRPMAVEAQRILAELTDNCDRLSDMQSNTTFDRAAKSVMASASYGVAKGLKALNELLHASSETAGPSSM